MTWGNEFGKLINYRFIYIPLSESSLLSLPGSLSLLPLSVTVHSFGKIFSSSSGSFSFWVHLPCSQSERKRKQILLVVCVFIVLLILCFISLKFKWKSVRTSNRKPIVLLLGVLGFLFATMPTSAFLNIEAFSPKSENALWKCMCSSSLNFAYTTN